MGDRYAISPAHSDPMPATVQRILNTTALIDDELDCVRRTLLQHPDWVREVNELLLIEVDESALAGGAARWIGRADASIEEGNRVEQAGSWYSAVQIVTISAHGTATWRLALSEEIRLADESL